MVQRLSFNAVALKDIAATFDTMYEPDKLYDYSKYITMYGDGKRVYFQMCVILDGASADSMVKLWEDMETEPFPPMIIDFKELRMVTKSYKEGTVIVEIDGNNVTFKYGKSVHVAELSTVNIPSSIVNTLDNFFSNNSDKLLDFNLLKLYNNMSDIGTNLTMNTLKPDIYGVMSDEELLVSTDGFSMRTYAGSHTPGNFMFPKHSIKILKMLPKLGTKCAVVDKRIYISGVNFQCYIGEWSGASKYPTDSIKKILRSELQEVIGAQDVINSIVECHRFTDLARINLHDGYATSLDKKHKEEFAPSPHIEEGEIVIHKNIMVGLDSADSLYANVANSMLKLITGQKTSIVLGVTNG